MAEGMTVRVPCADCGEVDLAPASVDVHVNRREDFALFAFTCPRCGEATAGGCRDLIRTLLDAGARRYELRSTSAPPLGWDDLLDLHAWLDADLPWPETPADVV